MTTTYELDRTGKTQKTLEYVIGDASYDVASYTPEGWKYEWWWTTGNTNWFIPSMSTDWLVKKFNDFNKPDAGRSLKVRLETVKTILDEREDLFTGDIYKNNPELETIPLAGQAKNRTVEKRKYNYTIEYNKVSRLINAAIEDGDFSIMVPFISDELKSALEEIGYEVYHDAQRDVTFITWEN